MATEIQWTDETWNPVTGCSKVSPGCAHCYAERVAIRLWPSQYPLVPVTVDRANVGDSDTTLEDGTLRPREFTDVQCHEDRLDQPLRWKKPRKIFVNSMSDLFHEDVPDAFIERVFSVMGLAERHTFQVLTKRADRMREWFAARRFDCKGAAILQTESGVCHYSMPWPLKNVWLGVSVENQHFADERIPLLLQTPAAVRFISAEPLLGPVDLAPWLKRGSQCDCGIHRGTRDGCEPRKGMIRCNLGLTRLSWVIVGGESGAGARPFRLAWARSIVDQCQAAGVPAFVKQLGASPIVPAARVQHWEWGGAIGREARFKATDPLHPSSAPWRVVLHDSHGGDPLEWPEYLRVREFPASGVATSDGGTRG